MLQNLFGGAFEAVLPLQLPRLYHTQSQYDYTNCVKTICVKFKLT